MRNLILYVAAVALTCVLAQGQAQEKVLYSFSGPDGSRPLGKLMADAAGNLYGTTEAGGTQDWGTVFELAPQADGTWAQSVLYNFCQDFDGQSCLDGGLPQAGLVADVVGNLYGTTYAGGGFCIFASEGCGTVFELSPTGPGCTWQETVLYKFCQPGDNNCSDGAEPRDRLTFDSSGNLYGTTSSGGANREGGTVFELSSGSGGWTEEVLYSFCSSGKPPVCPDGSVPAAGVTFDKSGNLYGTTSLGGSPKFVGYGVVYKLSPSAGGWTESVLDSFGAGVKGGVLMGAVNFDAAGNLYSTAFQGGQANKGVVFELTPKNGGRERSFSFSGTNGANPSAGVLIDPKSGALYGTTSEGGVDGCTNGCGTVFKIGAKGHKVVYRFFGSSNSDGAQPVAALIVNNGKLYGTTKAGGVNNQGTVFEIAP